jgi:hypothetical protein
VRITALDEESREIVITSSSAHLIAAVKSVVGAA